MRMREIISLNDLWDWHLPGGPVQKRLVPSCYFCVGDATCSREFTLTDTNLMDKRLILHFEGVHYSGAVMVNGVCMGDMLPYVFCDFDIGACARVGENAVNLLTIPVESGKTLQSIAIQAADRAFAPVVYGISAG